MTGIVVVTHFPSPYQVEYFDTIHRRGGPGLAVVYLHAADPARQWKPGPMSHASIHLERDANAMERALAEVAGAGLVVFNYYAESAVARMIELRARSGKPWCFWGERPGYRYPMASRLLRRWKLRALHDSDSAIWGIGRWAIEGYREEFGDRRKYFDIPYFSNLSRFRGTDGQGKEGETRFLYSGSMIHRKGVDLLAEAFARLAATGANVRLQMLGAGELEPAVRQKLAACANRVEWVGFKDWHELPAFYGSAHFLLAPSRHDGWGLIVPEALSSGIPVIASDRMGASREFIRDGENGWLVKANDADALYTRMAEAAKLGDGEWRSMRAACRSAVADHSIEHGADRFLEAAAGSGLRA